MLSVLGKVKLFEMQTFVALDNGLFSQIDLDYSSEQGSL